MGRKGDMMKKAVVLLVQVCFVGIVGQVSAASAEEISAEKIREAILQVMGTNVTERTPLRSPQRVNNDRRVKKVVPQQETKMAQKKCALYDEHDNAALKCSDVPDLSCDDIDTTPDVILGDPDDVIIPNPDNVGLGLIDGISKLNQAYDQSNFLYTNEYGIAPSNTTLTVQYVVGGGVTTNLPSDDINVNVILICLLYYD